MYFLIKLSLSKSNRIAKIYYIKFYYHLKQSVYNILKQHYRFFKYICSICTNLLYLFRNLSITWFFISRIEPKLKIELTIYQMKLQIYLSSMMNVLTFVISRYGSIS